MRPPVEDELHASPSLDRILDGRCLFAANYCIRILNKRRSRHAVNRGRDDDLKVKPVVVDGAERLMTPEERLEERGRRSGANRHAVHIWDMEICRSPPA